MKKIIYWLPRILAIILALFFAVFISEGFSEGFSWQDSFMHLIPTLVIVGITIFSWKYPRLGAWFFIALGIAFIFFFRPFFWTGILLALLPLAAGILFLIEGLKAKKTFPKKKMLIIGILAFILLLVLIYFAIFGRALKQSENHLGILLAIPQAIFSPEAVRIDDQKYLAKNSADFMKTMKRQGFSSIDQMGSGYFLEKDGVRYLSTSRMYSSQFMTFTIPAKTK